MNFESNADQYFSCLQTLLQNILSSPVVDQQLALACMVSLPLEKAFAAFKSGMATIGKDFARLVAVADVGAMSGRIWAQRTFQVDCEFLSMNARWWHQLSLLNIPFEEAPFRASRNGEYQVQFIAPLLKHTDLDILTCLEFASDYNVGHDPVYFEYIKALMNTGPGVVKNSEYQSCIMGVYPDITNRQLLSQLLEKDVLAKIWPYDYPRNTQF